MGKRAENYFPWGRATFCGPIFKVPRELRWVTVDENKVDVKVQTSCEVLWTLRRCLSQLED
jgi:hypothetical protein